MSFNKALSFPNFTLEELKEFINDIPKYDEIYENPNLTKEFILEHLEKFNYFKLQKYGFEEQDFVKYLDRLNDKSWKFIPAKYHELITLEVIDSFELSDYNVLVYAVKDIRVYQKYHTEINREHFFKIPLDILLDYNFFKLWIGEKMNIYGGIVSHMSEEHLEFMLQQSEDETRTVLCFGIFSLQFFEKYLLKRMDEESWELLSSNLDIDHRILIKYKFCLISTLKIESLFGYYLYKKDIPFFVIRDYYPLTMDYPLTKETIGPPYSITSLTNRGQQKYDKPVLYSKRHYYINNNKNTFQRLKFDF